MSQEAAVAAAERMKTDQGLRDELGAAGNEADVVGILNKAGFDVSAEDKPVLLAALQSGDGEVSDAQLENVSGAGCGGSGTFNFNIPGVGGFGGSVGGSAG